jgi:hypothetical protein
MKRLQTALTLTVVALAGCRPAPMPDAFPETLGAWHRTGPPRDLAAAQPPDALPPARIEQIRAASYEGPGKLEARVYALASAGVALDLVQRWEPRSDTVFFNSGRFLIVVNWQKAEKKELQAFMREIEKRFAKE